MNTSHYPSLELCKKLTEIGFPTTFQHRGENESTVIGCGEIPEGFYVSPSVMEMIDIMPDYIHDKIGQKKWLEIGKKFVAYSTNGMAVYMVDGPIPNAIAEMILWLHENSYIYLPK